jgi:hypothetical protein
MVRNRFSKNLVQLAVATVIGIVILTLPTFADPPKSPYRWEKPIRWEEKDGPEAREHGAVIVDEVTAPS